ncbi:hypothetical protein SK128_020797, partial [Halocaridina rubra]
EDVLSVELKEGRPQVLLDLGTGPLFLEVSEVPSLADGLWHRLDLFWGYQRAEVVVDMCQREMESGAVNGAGGRDCRSGVPLSPEDGGLNVGAPLQIGGLAHLPPRYQDRGWPQAITTASFQGCIRNLRVNGELRDLGEGVLSEDSIPGCISLDQCQESGKACPPHARSVSYL